MKLVCINCPLGCNLTAEKQGEEIIVTGNTCDRGKQYAIDELTNPKRVLTTTIPIISKDHNRLPVISSKALPKDKIMDVIKLLKDIEVKAPIKMNDVILENVLDLDIDIIASRSID